MKRLFFTLLVAMVAGSVFGQQQADGSNGSGKLSEKIHKIVFQLSTDDTLAHKALMKQLNNITTVAPDTRIEVVCHGPGLSMLMGAKSVVHPKITELVQRDIRFVACEFSMKERNVDKSAIIAEAGYVKAGIIEIVSKQEEGWSYIKSGF